MTRVHNIQPSHSARHAGSTGSRRRLDGGHTAPSLAGFPDDAETVTRPQGLKAPFASSPPSAPPRASHFHRQLHRLRVRVRRQLRLDFSAFTESKGNRSQDWAVCRERNQGDVGDGGLEVSRVNATQNQLALLLGSLRQHSSPTPSPPSHP